MGDIGEHFPPTDEEWRDADSIVLLHTATQHIAERNYQVVNVDVTVVCEQPRLLPHVPAMRTRLAGAIGIADEFVSVKGKTNEGMGWVGRGEGIAAMAVVLIDRVEG